MAEDITTIGELPDFITAADAGTTFIEVEDQAADPTLVGRKMTLTQLAAVITSTSTVIVSEAADLAGTLV